MSKHTDRGGVHRPDDLQRRVQADAAPNPENTGAASRSPCPPDPAKLITNSIESFDAARIEDLTRIERLTLANSLRLSFKDPDAAVLKCKLIAQKPHGLLMPSIDHDHLCLLKSRLRKALKTGVPDLSLASSIGARVIRGRVLGDLSTALEAYADEDLRTFTIIHDGWRIRARNLPDVEAAALKAQLRADMTRTGVFELEGPLVAFLHGEFDPISGTFQLHFHGITTADKAKALKRGLKSIPAYGKTASGAAGVRVEKIHDRVRQLTYIFKSFWPSRGLRPTGPALSSAIASRSASASRSTAKPCCGSTGTVSAT